MSGSVIRGTNDPGYMTVQYATEHGLAARKAAYANVSGADPREIALQAVREREPVDVLEVGCGEGELAARIESELGVKVVAIDQSARMVELTRTRDVEAQVADVHSLPFPTAAFDVVVAAWMLYDLADLDSGLAEIVRVLRPGGRLVAITNSPDHLAELLDLGGIDRWELPFDGDNGDAALRSHFPVVVRHEAYGTVTFADIDAVRSYYASSEALAGYLDRLPSALREPLVVRRRPVVFVADNAA